MRTLLIGLLFVCVAIPQSKTEKELQREIAALKASLDTATRERQAMSELVARLAAQGKVLAAAAATDRGRNTSAATVAASATEILTATAKFNAEVASHAAADAAAAATLAGKNASSQTYSLLIVQVFGFLSILAGFAYRGWTESRQRIWLKKDNAEKDRAALENHLTLISQLEGVKAAADSAYREANTVNQKIESIGVQLKDGRPLEGKQ